MKIKSYKLKSFSLFFKAILNTKHEMWVSLQVLIIITIILSVILFIVEHMVQPNVYTNLWDSCLWAFMSYIGDPGHFAEFTPITTTGRIIAVLIGIIGIAIFAVPAGLIGSGFMDAIAEDRKEQKLELASVTLHKRFRRIGQANSWFLNEEGLKRLYKFVPRKLSLAYLQVKTGMTTDEIIATVNYCPDMRLSNLASTERIADKPHDRLVVEHFPLNREYGCCINRESNVTIVAPSSATQIGSGNFAFSLAAMGGFNYVSKEIEPCLDEPFSFFSMDKSDLDIIGDYDIKENVESQALHFMYELQDFKKRSEDNNHHHWFIFILGTSKSLDSQIHLWRLATDKKRIMDHRIINSADNREYGSLVLNSDEDILQNIFQEICNKLTEKKVTIRETDQSIVTELDNTNLWKSINNNNIMVRLGGGVDCNAFSLRIAYEILVYNNAHLLIAKDIADAIKSQIEPEREIPESAKKCFMKVGDGFADDFSKEDVFLKSPQALKRIIDKGNEFARKKFEHLDLDGKEQNNYSKNH